MKRQKESQLSVLTPHTVHGHRMTLTNNKLKIREKEPVLDEIIWKFIVKLTNYLH